MFLTSCELGGVEAMLGFVGERVEGAADRSLDDFDNIGCTTDGTITGFEKDGQTLPLVYER